MTKSDLAWNMLIELRKETLESQRIRGQFFGIKITFISAAIGLIITNIDKIPILLLAVPAFTAIFFDLLINSYSFSIKRIGCYIRENIEPILKDNTGWGTTPLWEEYMALNENKQFLSIFGVVGFTLITVIIGLASIYFDTSFAIWIKVTLFVVLILFFIYDFFTFTIVKNKQSNLRKVIIGKTKTIFRRNSI